MKTIFALLLVCFSIGLHAAHFYVRSGASGSNNGSDWVNAWTNTTAISWAGVSAGDSIWIAGGSYGQLAPQASGTAGNLINIARVRTTNSAPTAAAGWSAAYDAPVTLNRVWAIYSANYWTLDGQVPHGGIIVTNTAQSNTIEFSTATANGVTLRNLLITGSCTNQTMSWTEDTRIINANFLEGAGTGLTVSDCTLEHAPSLVVISFWKDVTFERCKFWRNFAGNSGNHPNIMAANGCTNMVFRWNECTDWLAEGLMLCHTSGGSAPNVDWDVYGNLWHDSTADWNGRVMESQYVSQYDIRFHNNTVVSVHYGILVANDGSWGAGCVSSNNIFFNITATTGYGFGIGTDDYCVSDKTAPGANSVSSAASTIFANYAGKDYRLSASIPGANLGSAYAVDFAGTARGSTWDIGAYEFAEDEEVEPAAVSGSATAARVNVETLILR